MFKFIHAADIHLDSPLRGLEKYAGAPVEEIRNATRKALENLVRLAIDESVSFVLLAGDIYDGDWKDFNTGLYFLTLMLKLKKAGISVFVISGNHDAQSKITRELNPRGGFRALSARKPETVLINDLQVAVHGQSYQKRVVTEDLSKNYPEPVRGYFNIGLLHTSADGREGHEPYAPCDTSYLISKGYDYWALGHVHKREILCRDPWIVFPGNIQGRHIRESGDKGCTLVTVEDGRIADVEHKSLDVLRWFHCEVDVNGAETADEAVDRAGAAIRSETARAEGRFSVIRFHIAGSCNAHAELVADPERWKNEIRMKAGEEGAGEVWVEKIIFKTKSPIDVENAIRRGDPLGGLLGTIRNLEMNSDELSELLEDFDSFMAKLPSEIRRGDDAIDLASQDQVFDIIEDVKQTLLLKLLELGKKP